MIDSGNALLILRKWADETSSLLFRFESAQVACAMGGTISEGSDSTWQVRSRRGDATLSFRLDGCVFEYVERRAIGRDDAPDDIAEKAHLLIFFPPHFSSTGLPEERNTLTVSELLPSEIKETT
ncbi:MAG: hypothetical protein WAN35_08780 [Terracidiphilus sp.]